MRALKAFLLGALAVGALAYALLATIALTAQAGGHTLDVTLGPLVFVAVGEEGDGSSRPSAPGSSFWRSSAAWPISPQPSSSGTVPPAGPIA